MRKSYPGMLRGQLSVENIVLIDGPEIAPSNLVHPEKPAI